MSTKNGRKMHRIGWRVPVVAAGLAAAMALSGDSYAAWADEEGLAGVTMSSATVYETLPGGHTTAVPQDTEVLALCLTSWDQPNDGRPGSSSSDSPFGTYLQVNYAQGSGYIRSDKVVLSSRGADADGLHSC